jgi:FtsZ-binding cell division protein ZapB
MTDYLFDVLACYENEDEAAAAAAAATEEQEAAAAATAAAAKATFTQEQVNKFLADDRRKNETTQKAKVKALLEEKEAKITEAINSKTLTEQERDQLKADKEAVQTQLKDYRSKEETLRREQVQLKVELDGKVTVAEKRAQEWEGRYRDAQINRELLDASVNNEAYNATQLVEILQPKTKMVEVKDTAGEGTGQFQIMVDLKVVDDKGVLSVVQCSPAEAVKKMKTCPTLYGNLFKTAATGGVGGNSATGANPGGAGSFDPKTKFTQEQFRAERAKRK